MRQARDGKLYSKQQFVSFYGQARGEAMWNEASQRGAAEPAGAPAGAAPAPCAPEAVSELPPGTHSFMVKHAVLRSLLMSPLRKIWLSCVRSWTATHLLELSLARAQF